jgi:hypothetical protein
MKTSRYNYCDKNTLEKQFLDLGSDPLDVWASPGVRHRINTGAALVDAVHTQQTERHLVVKSVHNRATSIVLIVTKFHLI